MAGTATALYHVVFNTITSNNTLSLALESELDADAEKGRDQQMTTNPKAVSVTLGSLRVAISTQGTSWAYREELATSKQPVRQSMALTGASMCVRRRIDV